MYQMFLDERATLTLERAAFIIGEYPPILISMEEKLRMSKFGFNIEGTPEQRCAGIPISGFSLRPDDTMPRDALSIAAFRVRLAIARPLGPQPQMGLRRGSGGEVHFGEGYCASRLGDEVRK